LSVIYWPPLEQEYNGRNSTKKNIGLPEKMQQKVWFVRAIVAILLAFKAYIHFLRIPVTLAFSLKSEPSLLPRGGGCLLFFNVNIRCHSPKKRTQTYTPAADLHLLCIQTHSKFALLSFLLFLPAFLSSNLHFHTLVEGFLLSIKSIEGKIYRKIYFSFSKSMPKKFSLLN